MEKELDYVIKAKDIPHELHGVMGDVLYFAAPTMQLEHALFEGLHYPGEPNQADSPIRTLLDQYLCVIDIPDGDPIRSLLKLAESIIGHGVTILDEHPDNFAELNRRVNTWISAINHTTNHNVWSEVDEIHKVWKRKMSSLGVSAITD
jgi:hypothetical protein